MTNEGLPFQTARKLEGSGNRSDQLKGEVVLLHVLEAGELQTSVRSEPADCVWVDALIIQPDGSYRNLGTVPIFWTVIRRDLLSGKPGIGNWIAGRVSEHQTKDGRQRFMVLDEPSETEIQAATTAWSAYAADPQPVEQPDNDATMPPDGEPPF